jgi:hypothetical protein
MFSHCPHPLFCSVSFSFILSAAAFEPRKSLDGGVGLSQGCSSRFDRLVLVADAVSCVHVPWLSSAECVTMDRVAAGVLLQAWWYAELTESDMLTTAGGWRLAAVLCSE